jgi:hypothetical protein
MSRRPPFKLVPDALSHDTVDALRELLEQAEAGQVVGIAFAAMYKSRQFITNTAGECHRNPVFTRGIVSVLDDCLAKDIHRTNGNTGGC